MTKIKGDICQLFPGFLSLSLSEVQHLLIILHLMFSYDTPLWNAPLKYTILNPIPPCHSTSHWAIIYIWAFVLLFSFFNNRYLLLIFCLSFSLLILNLYHCFDINSLIMSFLVLVSALPFPSPKGMGFIWPYSPWRLALHYTGTNRAKSHEKNIPWIGETWLLTLQFY